MSKHKSVDGRDKPGHDEIRDPASPRTAESNRAPPTSPSPTPPPPAPRIPSTAAIPSSPLAGRARRPALHQRSRDHGSGNFAGADVAREVLAEHDRLSAYSRLRSDSSKRFSGIIFASTMVATW